MKRSAVVVLLVAALGVAGVGDAWARGGGKSGRSGSSGRTCSNHHSHSHSSVAAPLIVSRAPHGGYYGSYYSPAPANAYRYYCAELDRYYPEVPDCPSGFKPVAY